MNETKQAIQESLAEITEKTLVLAARSVGNGLGRMIVRYVSPALTQRFAMHLVEELLDEVRTPETTRVATVIVHESAN